MRVGIMWVAIIAVCAAQVGIANCDQRTAIVWAPLPERCAGVIECQQYGQTVAAAAGLVKAGEILKVFCRPE
jgi:hypothetical protein